ncbi:MAG: type IV secretion system DNA-binding domain-containing protein [Bryobacteraceae bacterium]
MSRDYKPPVWPRRYPRHTLLAFGVVLFCTAVTARHQRQELSSGIEKWYLWRYALASYRAMVNDRPRAVEFLAPRGGARFRIRTVTIPPSQYRDALKDSVYSGKPAWRILWQTVLIFSGLSASLVPLGVLLDRRHRLSVQQGVNRRGPELVSLSDFKRCVRYRRFFFFSHAPDGLTFFLHPELNPEPKPYRKGLPYIRIRKRDEIMNLGFVGDSGSGKTSLMKQILYQARERGDGAIINDPKREFLTEFYDERRGDILLDPSDERCPYWEFKGELPEWNKEAVAYTIANSILPQQPSESQFFRSHARKLIAYLIANYEPSPAEMIYWASHVEEIDLRVAGTEHESTMARNSPDQRAGIIGTFNEIMFALRMLPLEPEGRRTWSAKEWCAERRGWIFVPSDPTIAEALRSIQSMWLDLLLVHQLSAGYQKNKPVIWNVYDELDSLKKLPKLPDAMTKMRFTGNRMVIGFQNATQLEQDYGKIWKSILSQCFTYFVLRTKEPTSAEWLQGLLGKVSNDRIRETRTAGRSIFDTHSRSYAEEHRDEPLVLASEIQTLEPTQGYLSYGKSTLHFKAPYFPLPERPGFQTYIPRHVEVNPKRLTIPLEYTLRGQMSLGATAMWNRRRTARKKAKPQPASAQQPGDAPAPETVIDIDGFGGRA